MATIAVIDYGMGNLHSIAKALEYVAPNDRVEVSYDPEVLRKADRLVFPGVGAIAHCMAELQHQTPAWDLPGYAGAAVA